MVWVKWWVVLWVRRCVVLWVCRGMVLTCMGAWVRRSVCGMVLTGMGAWVRGSVCGMGEGGAAHLCVNDVSKTKARPCAHSRFSPATLRR